MKKDFYYVSNVTGEAVGSKLEVIRSFFNDLIHCGIFNIKWCRYNGKL